MGGSTVMISRFVVQALQGGIVNSNSHSISTMSGYKMNHFYVFRIVLSA
jgi:hypothetical protein